jgi:hypothetical protein
LKKHRPGRDTQVHLVTLIIGLITVFGVYLLGVGDDGGSEETELATFGTHVGFLQGQLVCELATISLAVSVISMRPNLPPDSRPTFILPHPGPRKRKRKRRYRTSEFLWEKKATTHQNRELNKGMVKFKNKNHSTYAFISRNEKTKEKLDTFERIKGHILHQSWIMFDLQFDSAYLLMILLLLLIHSHTSVY